MSHIYPARRKVAKGHVKIQCGAAKRLTGLAKGGSLPATQTVWRNVPVWCVPGRGVACPAAPHPFPAGRGLGPAAGACGGPAAGPRVRRAVRATPRETGRADGPTGRGRNRLVSRGREGAKEPLSADEERRREAAVASPRTIIKGFSSKV